ncbi:YlmH family RNA-binding protein [Sporosarcina sp. G11-34]|uniref:YlmH family RNA-binding protein n=1 Tax=Sporosarcina sp. G11-34 TaxID=2849605 RepID=UPI0022A9B859|nr:RNA-binding protein [Sporosarcina sp. G11-34]MCZ2258857.1 RNA-binding protein [Sporosarcina sp. G11-34]
MEEVMQHFRKDEQPYVEMAIGWIREVEDTYAPKLTGFLDPRQRFIVESIAAGTNLKFESYGAFSEAERMRVLIYPDYYVPEPSEYQITTFKVKYASKFLTLGHKDVLGSMMSLGIERSKFGDIRIGEDEVQFAVANELKDYMTANFTSIGKAKVTVEEVSNLEEMIVTFDKWIETMYIISSMRLDVVVAAVGNIARQKAATLIHGEKVKVNWVVRSQPAFELFEADMLSIRGFGRYKVLAVEGKTRKDKIRLLIGKLE